MKKIIYDIKNDTYERVGEVIDSEDQRYSSTHVSGGGSYTSVNNGVAYTTNAPVRSTTSHHHYQTIWIKESDGTEGSHELYNQDVDFREGHDVALLINKNNRHYERFINLTTGRYWRLRTRAADKGIIGRSFERIGVLIGSLLLAMIPVINLIMAIAGIFDVVRNKADYYIRSVRRRILSGFMSVIILASYYPAIPVLYQEMNLESPVPTEISITISPEWQRNFMSIFTYAVSKVDKEFSGAQEMKKDFDNLSSNGFIKKYKLEEKKITSKFVTYTYRNGYNRKNIAEASYVWYFSFLLIGWVFMYLMLMNGNKSHRKVSIMLDERAKEIQKEYDENKSSVNAYKEPEKAVEEVAEEV
jgi:hypothetical protein